MVGRFISFEGIDSSGKKTQTELLAKALKQKGYKVVKLSFPAYQTRFGKIVASFLRGEFFSLKRTIPEIASLLFAIDRYQFKDVIDKSLKEGKIIISNRFTQSAMAFESTINYRNKEKFEFIKWIGQVEARLHQPELIFFLDMPVEASRQLIEKRRDKKYLQGKKKDILEEDLTFQNAVRQTYLEMANKDKRWVVVECARKVDGKWQIRTPREIHADVLLHVEKFLK